ncbi:MAG: phage tail protein [Cyclobacteriaceae bacterium]
MAGDVQNNTWPLPKFHFEVKIGEEEWFFQEVSGLESEVDVLEYRHGKSKQFAVFKMPGMKKVSDITLKKGVFTGDTKLFEWFKKNKLNTIERKTITISLLNENHKSEIVWTLTNAFPKKIESTNLNAQGNEVAIETIVLSHEELDIKKGG